MDKHLITGTTTLTCLLGRPVSHSISPLMHNEAFRLLGLDCVYLCFDVGADELFFDHLPDDARHLIAIHLNEWRFHLNFTHLILRIS